MKCRYSLVRRIVWGMLVSGMFLSVPPATAQGFKWWQSETFTRELSLTAEQSAAIENIFQRTLPVLRRNKETLDKAEAQFNQMIETSDEAQIMAQVNEVEAARSELNKSRTMMLLRMRRVLSPEQRVKLVDLQHQTRDRRRGGNGGGNDHQRP